MIFPVSYFAIFRKGCHLDRAILGSSVLILRFFLGGRFSKTVGCVSILNNEYMICCIISSFFFFVHPVTAFKRGPHGRLVFAKCVLPSVNKVNYHYYDSINILQNSLKS